MLAIGGPGDGPGWGSVTLIGEDLRPGRSVPDLHSRVPTGGGQTGAIGRPGQPGDTCPVALAGLHLLIGVYVPDQDRRGDTKDRVGVVVNA